ncbi:MAG: leucyl/phenylalanyl-tRNA--protein transferase [Cellvibrionaceae bacterium]|jgi:leucyl/phenylalanyl-tRNA--protein transferase
MKLPWLDPNIIQFPDTNQALLEPNGLLAVGGQLSPNWLLHAYRQGIFPWFNEGDPILWWTPSPRMVIYPHQFHLSKSLRKTLKRGGFSVTINEHFDEVINACAAPREEIERDQLDEPVTWITPLMTDAYRNLHKQGVAHSIEVWSDNALVGGLYGLSLGEVFFGESMFSRTTNGSKIAIAHLVEHLKQWQYKLIDCQVYSDHLSSLGAIEIDRHMFEKIIHRYTADDDLEISAKTERWRAREVTLTGEYWAKLAN